MMFGAARQGLYLANPPTGDGTFDSATLLYSLANPNSGGGTGSDSFGYTTAVSDSYIAVGAYTESDGAGRVYVYSTATGSLLYSIANPNDGGGNANDYFGQSIAMTDDYLVVGAQQDTSTYNNAGRVYVFDPSTGTKLYSFADPNNYGTQESDYFGNSVGVWGNYMIAGAYAEDEAAGITSGVAYIFDLTTGTLTYTLTNPNNYNAVSSDQFGLRVAIGSSWAVVSAPFEDDSGGSNSGVVYVYDLADGSLEHSVVNPNAYGTTANDNFGWSLAVSGDTIAVGVIAEDSAAGTSSGVVYVIDATTGTVTTTITNPSPVGTTATDNFGASVALTGNLLAVSAPGEDEATATNSGKVYLYDITSGSLLQTIDNPNAYGTADNDNIGNGSESVRMTHDHLVVGAYLEDDATGDALGRAYVFELSYS